MALTPEQKIEARQRYGIPAGGMAAQSAGNEKLNRLKSAWATPTEVEGNQFEQKEESGVLGKARDFAAGLIGGGKVAEGAGMALAAPKVIEQQEDASALMSQAQDALMRRIREKKAAGEDTTRLRKALESSIEQNQINADVLEDFEDALPTDKQVIGSAARLVGTVALPTVAGGVASKVAPAAPTILSGASRGAKIGALTGAAEGAVQGAGIAAEADKPAGEIIESGIWGGVGGGLLGGAIGGVAGGVSGGMQKAKVSREKFAQELVSPKLSAKERAAAISKGRLKDPTLLGKAELEASARDIKLAEAVDDVVSPKATVSQNVEAIRSKIDSTDNAVTSYVERNKVPFNTNQLNSKLRSGKEDLNLIFASDSNAERTYDAVMDAFMDSVGKKDTAGLLSARKDFDQIPAIKKLLDTDTLGENARKEIVLTVRRKANEYIASLLPQGNKYRDELMQEHYMIEALGNLSEKAQSIIGKNKLQLLTEEYPILKWFIGGLVGAAGVGVGSTIIGSTD